MTSTINTIQNFDILQEFCTIILNAVFKLYKCQKILQNLIAQCCENFT